ncbi:TetR family transcriptional regulator [Actinocorallia herbida]|uniref:TetR family transcriptional regulator n=1 Tax=Actinocorallia herbida TaxID=58109 RepID=A0A3N1D5P4_9ACTN|nr:TetR/AcrR family transcriptional regulator [Actinocorallia herbida]ROO88871.1 TetR family transcriptional regulator [Actinocorallia herbida]
MSEDKAKQIIWARPARSTRGPNPSLTLERIARASVALADAEGLDALTMRRLAKELGTGTMSLYRYVESKDDLLDIMKDIVLTEIPRPAHPDWRTGLGWLAHQIRAQTHRHPWLAQTDAPFLFLSPHGIEYVEYLYGIIDGLGLSADAMMNAVSTVVAYATGAVRQELASARRAADAGVTEGEWMRAHGPYLATLLATGRYPLMKRVVLEADTPHLSPEEGFEQGLQGVLDAVAAGLPGASAR